MTQDYKTIRVPADDYDAAKASKHDSETWGEFLQRCTDEPPEVREFVDADDLLEGQSVTKSASIDYSEIQTRVEKAVRKVLQ